MARSATPRAARRRERTAALGPVGVALTALAVPGLGPGAPAQSRQPTKAYLLWREDVRQLARELPARHKNAFAKISETRWRKLVAAAIEHIGPGCDIPHFAAELLRLIAAIGDSHTQLAWHMIGLPAAPVCFFAFDDGVYVTVHPKETPALARAKVVRVQGVPIDTALERLRPYLPAENAAVFKNFVVRFLPVPALLEACGVGRDPRTLELGLEGRPKPVRLEALPPAELRKVRLTHAFAKVPQFLDRARDDYSYRLIEDGRVLYLSYDRCRKPRGFAKLVARMRAECAGKPLERIVLDLRRNGGGASQVIAPLFGALLTDRTLKKARLFVLVGRRTFSSALLNALTLKQKFHALLVGEPTGGKPNHFGEVRSFRLKHSRLPVYYSTKYFRRIEDSDPPSLVPDVRIPLLARDAFAGKDPALAYCLTCKLR